MLWFGPSSNPSAMVWLFGWHESITCWQVWATGFTSSFLRRDTRASLRPLGTTTLPQQSSPAQFRHKTAEDLLKASSYHKKCQNKVQIAMQSMKTKDT